PYSFPLLGSEQRRVEGGQACDERLYLVERALGARVDASLRTGQRAHVRLDRVAALLPGPFSVALHLAKLKRSGERGLETRDVGAGPPPENSPHHLVARLSVARPRAGAAGRGKPAGGGYLLGQHRVSRQIGEGLAAGLPAPQAGPDWHLDVLVGVHLDTF